MSIISVIRNKLRERRLSRLAKLSDAIVNDVAARINGIQQQSKSVSRIPSAIVSFKPIKKKRQSRDRELMSNGTYLNRYNFGDMYSAYTRETYVKVAVDKYIEEIIQRGYHFDSKTQQVVDYLRKRVKELEFASNKSIVDIIRDITFSLILFGNAFLVKQRDSKRSSGIPHIWNGKKVEPIAGWYVVDPRRVLIRETKSGDIEYVVKPVKVKPARGSSENIFEYFKNLPSSIFSYISQGTSGMFYTKEQDELVFKSHEVEHIRYHHTPGEKWAMPPFWPVLEDINMLRSIETAVDLLIYQFGSLLIHVKVSNPVQNIANSAIKRQARPEDIIEIQEKLNTMESNGFIVTGDHVSMDVLQVAGNILQLENYLSYFKARVFSGLWLSPITVGETGSGSASRSSANVIAEEKLSKVLELQSILSSTFERLFLELLLEAGLSYSQITRPSVYPRMVFDDVDVELRLKKQESTIRLYESGLVTEDEARRSIGLDKLTDKERELTYARIVKGYLIEKEAEAKLGLVMSQASSAESNVKLNKKKNNKQSPASRQAQNKVVPENQYGKKFNSRKAINK